MFCFEAFEVIHFSSFLNGIIDLNRRISQIRECCETSNLCRLHHVIRQFDLIIVKHAADIIVRCEEFVLAGKRRHIRQFRNLKRRCEQLDCVSVLRRLREQFKGVDTIQKILKLIEVVRNELKHLETDKLMECIRRSFIGSIDYFRPCRIDRRIRLCQIIRSYFCGSSGLFICSSFRLCILFSSGIRLISFLGHFRFIFSRKIRFFRCLCNRSCLFCELLQILQCCFCILRVLNPRRFHIVQPGDCSGENSVELKVIVDNRE